MSLVQIGFVKHHSFTVTPTVTNAIDIDVTVVMVGGGQTQVVTQGTRIRIAMSIELTARW